MKGSRAKQQNTRKQLKALFEAGQQAGACQGRFSLRPCELRSVTRSQLNIKIDPELLQRLRSHAARQGTTLTEFVASVLVKAISGDEHLSLEERVNRIEKHLGL